MIRNVDIQLKSVRNQVLRKEITEDIVKIQVLPNEKVFRKAIQLFIEKWSGFAEIISFIDYFRAQWCSERSIGWFESHAIGAPSTSNAIESTHHHMKNFKDLRKKTSLRKFLKTIQTSLIHEWSMEHNIQENVNAIDYATKPSITVADTIDAYKWNEKNAKVIALEHNGEKLYFTHAGNETDSFNNSQNKKNAKYLLVQYAKVNV